MKFGFTYIARNSQGHIEPSALQPFGSFDECCAAAIALARARAQELKAVEVIYCRYDATGCIPELCHVLRTITPGQTAD